VAAAVTIPDVTGTLLSTGATVTVPQGGSGATTFTVNGVLIGETTSAFHATAAGTTGIPLVGVTGSDPAFGTALVPGGGTGLTTATIYGLLVGEGTAAFQSVAAGTQYQFLISNSSANPGWSSWQLPSTGGTNNQCLTSNGTNGVWGSCSTGSITGSSLAAAQVAVATGSSAITSYAGFTSDSSGNVTAASVTISNANPGIAYLGQGTTPWGTGTTAVGWGAPTVVTSYNAIVPSAASAGTNSTSGNFYLKFGTAQNQTGCTASATELCGYFLTSVPLSDLATQAADTLVMNESGSSLAPTAVSVPNTGTGQALGYNTGTHVLSAVTLGSIASGTTGHLGYYASSTNAISDMGSDFTFSGHTVTGGASAILDLHSASNLLLPSAMAVGTNTSAFTIGDYTTTGGPAFTFTDNATSSGDATIDLQVTTQAGSYHDPFAATIGANRAFSVCNTNTTTHTGIVVTGSGIDCHSLTTTQLSKTWDITATSSYAGKTILDYAVGYTANLLQLHAHTVAGTGFNFFEACAGASSTDGSCSTYLSRIDGTGSLYLTPAAKTSGVLPYFQLTIPTDTGLTHATEAPGFQTVTATRTWENTAGTVATQREYFFVAPTYAAGANGQTFTKAATVAISGAPGTGANVTYTNGPYALWVQAGSAQFDGGVTTTTLAASSTVSGTGFSTYLASPPTIGGTAPGIGDFTTVNCGVSSATACIFTGYGTSGSATLTWPAAAGTTTNPIVSSNVLSAPSYNATATTNQLVLGTTNTTTLNFAAPASSVVITGPIVASGLVYATSQPSAGFAKFAGSTYATTSAAIAASDLPAPTTTVSSGAIAVTTNNTYVICTTTCAVTPPQPAAGVQLCVRNAPGSATVITMAAMSTGNSFSPQAYYELTTHAAWGTLAHTIVSSGAATDSLCLVGYDSSHYAIMSYTNAWTD